MKAQSRYKANPKWDGRKERDGYVTGKGTMGVLWCVAVKRDRKGVHVRDTKDLTDTTLSFSKKEWEVFITGIKSGEFNV